MGSNDQHDFYSLTSTYLPTGRRQYSGYILEPLEIRRAKAAYLTHDVTTKVGYEDFSGPRVKKPFEGEDIRKQFVFKLFALLSCQFLFLLLVTHVFSSMGGALLLFFLLGFIKPLRKIRPLNSVALWIMVCLAAVSIASITSLCDLIVVTYAFAMETAISVFITILAKFAPCDVAGCAMIFCVMVTLLAVFGLVTSLIWLITKYSIVNLLIGGGSMTLLTMYLLFSTQVMMDNSTVSPDEIVRGNINLYVGIILLINHAIMLLVRKCYNRTNEEH